MKHLARWKKYGQISEPNWPIPPLQRLLAKRAINPDTGCWEFLGHRNKNTGYAYIGMTNPRRHELIHRVSYELYRGAIPPGMEVNHICLNRACFNPEHLSLVTVAENRREAARRHYFTRKITTPPPPGDYDVLSLPGRWHTRIRLTDSGCWEWTGGRTQNYGATSVQGRFVPAHRAVYAALVGQIPSGLHLHHLCCNGFCVNPAHLEPVTPTENNRHRDQAYEAYVTQPGTGLPT